MSPFESRMMATTKEIREALGLPSSMKSDRVFNAAIRQWIRGGGELLEALHRVNELAFDDDRYVACKERALADLQAIKAMMTESVREKEL